MFERFTDRARRVVVLAQEEARLLGHNYIGTEHILLGLTHEGEGVAAQALGRLGVSLDEVRTYVEDIIGLGGGKPPGHIPFTPRAKKVIELSMREALQLGHNYIGTEHLLLGLIREGEGIGANFFLRKNIDLSLVRQTVVQVLARYNPTSPPTENPPEPIRAEDPDPVWYLIEYQDARGDAVSVTINDTEGWFVDPEGFVRLGGHAINQHRVISILRVDGPLANNTTIPAGMKPSDSPAPQPTALAEQKPWKIIEAPTPRPAAPKPPQTYAEKRDAIENALNEARKADPNYGYTVPGESDEDAKAQRQKTWGDRMGKAISRSREFGGLIYVPRDGSNPDLIPLNYDEIIDLINDLQEDGLL